jgi:hypothetical protein
LAISTASKGRNAGQEQPGQALRGTRHVDRLSDGERAPRDVFDAAEHHVAQHPCIDLRSDLTGRGAFLDDPDQQVRIAACEGMELRAEIAFRVA